MSGRGCAPLILFAFNSRYLVFFDPTVNLPRALALSAVLGALGLIVGLTLWRKALGIPYEYWRISHGFLAVFVVLVGLVHILQVGHHVSPVWKQAIWVGVTALAVGLFVYTRLYKPHQLEKFPWEVVEVRSERGRNWTLVLEPRGHDGLEFTAGQFCYFTMSSRVSSMTSIWRSSTSSKSPRETGAGRRGYSATNSSTDICPRTMGHVATMSVARSR